MPARLTAVSSQSSLAAAVVCALALCALPAVAQESRLGGPRQDLEPQRPAPRNPVPAAEACKPNLQANAASETQDWAQASGHTTHFEDLARRLAIRQWIEKAHKEFGPEFGSWLAAQGKVVSCSPLGNTVRCQVVAAPCSSRILGARLKLRRPLAGQQ